jgi:hypothetical protein
MSGTTGKAQRAALYARVSTTGHGQDVGLQLDDPKRSGGGRKPERSEGPYGCGRSRRIAAGPSSRSSSTRASAVRRPRGRRSTG